MKKVYRDHRQFNIFTANICSNLLPSCSAVTDLLTELGDDEKLNIQQKKLVSLKQAVQGIEYYFTRLIDFAHLVKQQPELVLTHINFPETLKRLSSSMSAVLLVKQLKLTIRYDNELPDVLMGDYLRIEYILLGLLSNALKFTSYGEISLTLSKEKQERDNLWVKLVVRDTGEGISPNDREKIFQAFHYTKPRINKPYFSTGLGLTFIKQFLEDIGGIIRVDHEKQHRGAIFVCMIPFKLTNDI